MSKNTEKPLEPEDLPQIILGHVEALATLLRPLQCGYDPGGYIIDEPPEPQFTERAYRLARQAHDYAESATHDIREVAGTIAPSTERLRALDHLAYEASYGLAGVTAALAGPSTRPRLSRACRSFWP